MPSESLKRRRRRQAVLSVVMFTLFQAACGILHDKARLARMESSMASLGIRDAAERIYQTVSEIKK